MSDKIEKARKSGQAAADVAAVKAQPEREKVGAFLKRHTVAIAHVLPPGHSAERVIGTVAMLVTRNHDLAECPVDSVLAAVIQGCSLGLDFSPATGQAYIVPRWDKHQRATLACFQAGYRGLIHLALQSDKVLDIEARVVREGDDFAYTLGTAPTLSHTPMNHDADVIGAYAVAYLAGGRAKFEYMTRAQLDAIRARYAAEGSGMWAHHFDEACRKTVVRRLCKYLPMTPQLAAAIDAEDAERPIEATATAKAAPAGDLKDRMRAKAQTPELAAPPPAAVQDAWDAAEREATTTRAAGVVE